MRTYFQDMGLTLADRDVLISRMDKNFSDHIQMRKDVNRVLLKGNHILSSIKSENKVFIAKHYSCQFRSQRFQCDIYTGVGHVKLQ